MINSIEISNFKNIRHQKIDLERLTVFVGANGSGKTSVLEAISFFDLSVKLTHESDHSSRKSRILYSQWLDQLNRSCTIGAIEPTSISCARGDCLFKVSAKPIWQIDNKGLDDPAPTWTHHPDTPGEQTQRESVTRSLTSLQLNPEKLKNPTYTEKIPPQIAKDGDGLASTLAYMALNDPDEFSNLESHLRSIVKQLKRIRFTKRPVQEKGVERKDSVGRRVQRKIPRRYFGESMLFDFDNADGVSAEVVSEGTLILLGFLTVILGPKKASILQIDDIDRGLHPLAQKNLIGVLNQLMERFPDLQILATTHSPYLLDSLQPEQVRLMALDDEGYSVCGKLTDHPQFDRWKDEMAPGELWSLFGEKWVAEGSLAK